MPISKRRLAFAAVVVATLGNSTKADSLSSNSGTWNWWVSGQGQTGWSSNPRPFASRLAAFDPTTTAAHPAASTPVATPTPVAASSATPTYTASASSVSAPLIAVPYNNPSATTQAAAAATTYTAPTPAVTSTPAPTTTSSAADGFINMGTGPYPADAAITTGGTQPWYNTSLVNPFFGGHPTAQQQADFSNAVLQDVKHTFALSGVNVNLTNDPSVAANHTLSVVSNTSAALLPSAIGMTEVGGNGFSFMNQEAKAAQNLNQLELIVAHNVSHELMLAFGVGENYDKTGNYIDAPNASFSMMTSDSATFSKAAADALNKALQAEDSGTGANSAQFAQEINAQPVPEPAAIAIWILGLAAVAVRYRGLRRSKASV